MTKKNKKISGGAKFLVAMVLIYGITAFFDASFAATALTSSFRALVNLFPLLIFVFAIVLVVNYFVRPELIKRYLGHDSGKKGILYALFASVIVSSPPYVVFPLLGEMNKQGMKHSLVAIFMNNRNVQPAFLPFMVYYFGPAYTIVVSAYILMFAVVNGVILGRIMDKS